MKKQPKKSDALLFLQFDLYKIENVLFIMPKKCNQIYFAIRLDKLNEENVIKRYEKPELRAAIKKAFSEYQVEITTDIKRKFVEYIQQLDETTKTDLELSAYE